MRDSIVIPCSSGWSFWTYYGDVLAFPDGSGAVGYTYAVVPYGCVHYNDLALRRDGQAVDWKSGRSCCEGCSGGAVWLWVGYSGQSPPYTMFEGYGELYGELPDYGLFFDLFFDMDITPPQSSGCGDERDDIIQEYIAYSVGFTPPCEWFTQTARSAYFSFSELTVNSPYSWALIKWPLVVAPSLNYGLDYWRDLLGAPQIVNSGYRSPRHNHTVGGAPQSRHLWGDAVDLRNFTRSESEYWEKRYAAIGTPNQPNAPHARADYVEPLSGPCGYGCVHADWRSTDEGRYAH